MSGRVGEAVDDAHVFHAIAERGLDALDQPLHRILGSSSSARRLQLRPQQRHGVLE
jgi:hypothetical protein